MTDQVDPLAGAWDAILIFSTFILLALAAAFLMQRLSLKPPRAMRQTPVPEVIRAVSGAVVFLLVAQGALFGLASLHALAPWATEIRISALVVAVILITAAASRGVKVVLAWAVSHRKPDGKPYLDEALVPLLRLSLTLSVYVIGGLVLLDQMNVAVTPLIAGIGMGGLAIALSLQPTLVNFLAGTHIASDRLVKAGDYIELQNGDFDGGVRGYVVEVGWRSTRIRTPANNLVTIPNAKLAESVITNYQGPTMEVAVMVTGGVSFSSDLEHVERVAIEAAAEVIQDLPEAVPSRDPWFAYDTIGESNVTFWVWVYAKDRIASFRLTSELIKRLFLRFRQEGIQINYPVRQVLSWELPTARPVGREARSDVCASAGDEAPAVSDGMEALPNGGSLFAQPPPVAGSGATTQAAAHTLADRPGEGAS